jgi:3-hydroxybutyryl-CoA dehydrogenase
LLHDKRFIMIVAILADAVIKAEILSKGYSSRAEIVWVDSLQSLRVVEADAYFDLLFEKNNDRIDRLKFLLPKPVFINSVVDTCSDIGANFIRLNAWPTMLNRNLTEIALPENAEPSDKIKNIFNELGWQYQVVPDTVGMITPRIIAMIINEAWFALSEGISTREEIDTAMRSGTNYPYGPFEWYDKIGAEKVQQLLAALLQTNPRYTIAPGLNPAFVWR